MAVLACAEVTLTDQTDASALVTWYLLTASATRPAAPATTDASAAPAGGWTKAEPAYSGGATSYLWTCLQLVWGDGTCDWGDVQLSSSYEAAKAAWNKAQAAGDAAAAVAQHFWHDSSGAHVGTVAGDAASGQAVTVASGGMAVLEDGAEVAGFGASGAHVGATSGLHAEVSPSGFGVLHGTDRLLHAEANGEYVRVYAGGSTAAAGCKYTNAEVSDIVALLGSGCAPDGDAAEGVAIVDADGAGTGYALGEEVAESAGVWYVLNADGEQIVSGYYDGVLWRAADGGFQPNYRYYPAEETPGSPTSLMMGRVGAVARDGALAVDAPSGASLSAPSLDVSLVDRPGLLTVEAGGVWVDASGSRFEADATGVRVENGWFVAQAAGIDHDAAPAASVWDTTGLIILDGAGARVGYVRAPDQADGRRGIQMEAAREVGGSTVYNGVQLDVNASGTRSVTVSDAAAWRSAIAAAQQWTFVASGSTLPAYSRFLLLFAHNSTPALNGMFILATGTGVAFKLCGAANVTVTYTKERKVSWTVSGGGSPAAYYMPVI